MVKKWTELDLINTALSATGVFLDFFNPDCFY